MKRICFLFTMVIILTVLLAGCGLSAQVVSQPTAQPPQSTATTVAQDNNNASLQATISALETRVAAVSQVSDQPVSKSVETDALPTNTPLAQVAAVPAAAPTAIPTAVPTTIPTTVPTAVSAPTQTPKVINGVPVVYITPIAPLQYPYYTQPYYPQPQAYPYPYPYSYQYPNNPYPNTFVPCNRATFIADVTVADDTNFAQGASFTKTWRLRNDGTCTWTTGYSLVFDHGSALGGPTSVSFPANVAPGATIDLSVNLVAPSADGLYQGFWMLQDASSSRFGIGYSASVAFWVKISVGAAAYYYQGPYYYPSAYPYPYPYNPPSQPVYTSGNCQLVAVSPAMDSTVAAKDDFDIKWTIKNTSGSTWTRDAVDYKYISGTKMYKNSAIYDLQSDVTSGSQAEIVVDTVTPANAGWYTTTWGLDQNGTRLCTMSITLHVK
jgi:hypothetical protein